MKKKILVLLGIIITLIPMIFICYVASIKKTPATVEQYVNAMNKYDINAVNLSNQIPEDLKQYVYEYGEYNSDWFKTNFYVYDSSIRAQQEFEIRYKDLIRRNANIEKKKIKGGLVVETYSAKTTKEISVSNNRYKYKTFHFKDGYIVFIRVENTVIFIGTDEANKDNVDIITKELGYHIGNMYPVLFAIFIIAEILFAVLMCLYIANIFKKHNVYPWIAFIPIVNIYYLCKIADKNGWKMLFFIIPFFCYIYYFILAYKLTRIYTDKKLICFGMGFLPLVLLPLISFDEPRIEEKSKNIYEEILKEDGVI